jgi:dihydroorotase
LLFSLVGEKKLSFASALRALTGGPAAVLGLPAPALATGNPADLVLVAPSARWQVTPGSLHGKCKNSPFMGKTLDGRVDLTLARGCIAFDRSRLDEPAALEPS